VFLPFDLTIDFAGDNHRRAPWMDKDVVEPLPTNISEVDHRVTVGQRLQPEVDHLIIARVTAPLAYLLHANVENDEPNQHGDVRRQDERRVERDEQSSNQQQKSNERENRGGSLALRDV